MAEATIQFNMTIPAAKIYISGISPRTGTLAGGTDVRVTLTGLHIVDTSSVASLPSVMFGSAPAASVSVIVSDVGVTIISARTPQATTAGVVPVIVAREGNATFAYMSTGVSATCISRICEVDAVAGGTLTMRVGGLAITYPASVKCMIDASLATATAVTAAGPGLFDVVLQLPGAGKLLDDPLTTAFVSISTVGGGDTLYADVLYRSPPRAPLAEFTSDGSRIEIAFDQRTNGAGATADCARFVQPQQPRALGEQPMCSWSVDGQTLSVMLGKGATITVGDAIYFLAGTVRSLNGVSSANPGVQLVTVARPAFVLPPRCHSHIHIYMQTYTDVFYLPPCIRVYLQVQANTHTFSQKHAYTHVPSTQNISCMRVCVCVSDMRSQAL